jgi:hypothetical protein
LLSTIVLLYATMEKRQRLARSPGKMPSPQTNTDTLCTLQYRRRVGTFVAHLRSEIVAAAAPEMGNPRRANDGGENLLFSR